MHTSILSTKGDKGLCCLYIKFMHGGMAYKILLIYVDVSNTIISLRLITFQGGHFPYPLFTTGLHTIDTLTYATDPL